MADTERHVRWGCICREGWPKPGPPMRTVAEPRNRAERRHGGRKTTYRLDIHLPECDAKYLAALKAREAELADERR